MEKQIEEMAKVINGKVCKYIDCEKCRMDKCTAHLHARKLYEAGYRKQVQGEWVIQDKELGIAKAEAKCSICGRDVVYQIIDNKWQFENYCPHCGAKMKGAE